MAAPAGTKVTFHSEDGPKDGVVKLYDGSHEGGDHVLRVVLGGKDRHTGQVHDIWSIEGTETGAFTVE